MTTLRKLSLTASFFLGACLVPAAHADMDESMDKMCEKMKSCGVIELKKQGLSEEMQSMMIGMFDGMCKTMFAKHVQTVGQKGLENKAEACVDSMVEASCDELLSEKGDFKTDECDEFEQAAEAAGVDLG